MTLDRLLTIEEVADLLRTTPTALYSSRHRREAPGALAVRVGKRLLWRPSDLEAWLVAGGADPDAHIRPDEADPAPLRGRRSA